MTSTHKTTTHSNKLNEQKPQTQHGTMNGKQTI